MRARSIISCRAGAAAPRRESSMDRRKFLSAGGFSLTAAFLAACNIDRSPRAQRALDLAEKRNEGVERSLFHHASMDNARSGAKIAGAAFPSYFILGHRAGMG